MFHPPSSTSIFVRLSNYIYFSIKLLSLLWCWNLLEIFFVRNFTTCNLKIKKMWFKFAEVTREYIKNCFTARYSTICFWILSILPPEKLYHEKLLFLSQVFSSIMNFYYSRRASIELGLDSMSMYLFHWLWRQGKVMLRWTTNQVVSPFHRLQDIQEGHRNYLACQKRSP